MRVSMLYATLFFMVCSVSLSAAQPQRQVELAPKVVPGVTEAMQSADFWISRIANPDRVIMTPAQIHELNRNNRTRAFTCTDINGDPFSFYPTIEERDRTLGLQPAGDDPLAIRTFSGDSLRVRLERHMQAFDLSRKYDYRHGKWTEGQISEVMSRIDMNAIPETITPRYGILVSHTLNRAMPTSDAVYGGPGGWLDEAQSGGLDMAQPVAVLLFSPANDWCYVRSEIAFGWIPAANVALSDAQSIRRYVEAQDFLVATAHKVPVFGDNRFSSHLVDFYLGARIRLIKKTSSGFQVSVPVRKPDGNVEFVTAWVRPDARVSVGYQPYTQRNILNTVFSVLYRPYGWADERNERDCCGTVRAVLRTFGITTGRWTTHQLHSSDHVYAFPRNTTGRETKIKYLDTCEPGITLAGDPGHIAMYLGKVDDRHFVIHQSGYSYQDPEGVTRLVNRVNVNDVLLEGGSHIDGWQEITEIKP